MSDKIMRMAVIINSCDAYCDLWDPFFTLMDKYWRNCQYRVYLNTETKLFKKKYNNISVITLNLPQGRIPEKTAWSRRMLDVLNRIDEKYVFILVDDFFLREDVQSNLIENILDKMDNDNHIAQVQLFGTRVNCDSMRKNTRVDTCVFEQIGDDKAKVCFVPTIWRKETMKKWLRPWESIWSFESCGAQRAKRWNYPEKVIRVHEPAIFNYLWEKDCYCVVNGKWMVHPLLEELFQSHNIYVDFNKRGTITMEEWQKVSMRKIISRYSITEILIKVFNRVRSIF